MRADALGFFWEDLPPIKKPKVEQVKRTPPEPVWLRDDYLPGLEEALQFPIEILTDVDIISLHQIQDRFMYDIEVYPNYFCAIFRSLATGKVAVFEMTEFERRGNWAQFEWMIQNLTIVTFNGINFDMPITALALDGVECDILKIASDDIILNGFRPQDILKRHKVKRLPVDHIDLIEVAPLFASLKTYGGRLHVPRMQDLPFHPNTELSNSQIAIVRWYCVNDTTSTAFLHECLKQQIELRYTISNEQGIDLRSKSDAQIAEAIISAEYQRRTGRRAQRPTIEPGTMYRYERGVGLRFQTEYMDRVLRTIEASPFFIGEDGYVALPESISELKIEIGQSVYRMGIGGLHSTEKTISHYSDDYWQLVDKDVASYYPKIILNNRYYPEHLGPVFLDIFGGITQRRLDAKTAGNKAIADSLKIVINGTFGKLGSSWSIMYAPKLMFHVTLGGQLYLLMLIEALELQGIRVVSGNTDGIMIKCPRHLLPLMDQIVKWWEKETGLELEGSDYKALYSRDINNYIAVTAKGKVKRKGAYANPWNDPDENPEKKLHKNPVTTICIEAVENYLTKKIPLEVTIRECIDIRKFIRIQSVKGGAVKDGQFLGKSIRWYYAQDEEGEIVYANSGKRVPRSVGGRPLMQLPDLLPSDIDQNWYVAESQKILTQIGVNTN